MANGSATDSKLVLVKKNDWGHIYVLYYLLLLRNLVQLSINTFSCHLSSYYYHTVHPCYNSLRPSDAYMRQWAKHHWFRWWFVAWSVPSHYLNQSWNIVNLNLRNKFQWNVNRNSYFFSQESAFENVFCEMAAILSRPQCDNTLKFPKEIQ